MIIALKNHEGRIAERKLTNKGNVYITNILISCAWVINNPIRLYIKSRSAEVPTSGITFVVLIILS